MNLDQLVEYISDAVVDEMKKSDSFLNTPNTLSNFRQAQLYSETLGLAGVFKQGPIVEGIKIGNANSGNYGHSGRPGQVGGSGGGLGESHSLFDKSEQEIKDIEAGQEVINKDVFKRKLDAKDFGAGGKYQELLKEQYGTTDVDLLINQENEFTNKGGNSSLTAIVNKFDSQNALYDKLKDDKDFIALAERDFDYESWKRFTSGPVGTPEEYREMKQRKEIRDLIDQWSKTSGDTDPKAVAMQMAANELFGVGNTDHLVKAMQSDMSSSELIRARKSELESELKFNPGRKAFLQTQYDATQDYLSKNNIKEMIVYRGHEGKRSKLDGGNNVEVNLQPLSSFSMNADVAVGFAVSAANGQYATTKPSVIVSVVPAKRIFALPNTGIGCTGEKEVVVLGGKTKATVVAGHLKIGDSFGQNSDALNPQTLSAVDFKRNLAPKDATNYPALSSLREGKSIKKDLPNLDEDLENADWTKRSWDLPEFGSAKFDEFLASSGMTLEKFKTLPVYKWMLELKPTSNKSFSPADSIQDELSFQPLGLGRVLKHLPGQHDQLTHGRGGNRSGIEMAPKGTERIEKYRQEATERIKEWQESGMSDEKIIYEGYQWRQWAQDRNNGWDWAMWEKIQGLAKEKGFEYKKNLTPQDIWDNPKIPMELLGKTFEGRIDTEVTNYRNNNNKNSMREFLGTDEGKVYTKLSQRKLWENSVWNEDKEVSPGYSGLHGMGKFLPYPGLQSLSKTKTFEEALNTEVEVYRGVSKTYSEGNMFGLTSFTTAPAIAKAFAEGYLRGVNKPGEGKVISVKIPFKDIKGFINPDGEYEVLLNVGRTKKSIDKEDSLDEDWMNFLHRSFRKKSLGLSPLILKGGHGSGIKGHRTYREVNDQKTKNLKEIAEGKAKRTAVEGAISTTNIKDVVKNMRNEADLYTSYLAPDTAVRMRDFISSYEGILFEGTRNKEFKAIQAKDLDDFGIDAVQKMMHQEIESNRLSFTDHGIRHLEGNTQRQLELMDQMGSPTAMEKLSALAIMTNHDMGYTIKEVREGGNPGGGVHQKASGEMFDEQKSQWNEDKVFTAKQFNRISDAIKTHDSTEFTSDNLINSTRISDNLALFAKEKLPSMFKYVKGGSTDLVEMGKVADSFKKNKDKGLDTTKDAAAFEVLRNNLYKKIDASKMHENLKRDLKAGTKTVGMLTPKFSLGVLAGEISSIKGNKKGQASVEIQYSAWDSFLQTRFDMGQKQTHKLLGDYGVTDFTKTDYDLGGVLELKVVGVPKKDLSDIIQKHKNHPAMGPKGGSDGSSTASKPRVNKLRRGHYSAIFKMREGMTPENVKTAIDSISKDTGFDKDKSDKILSSITSYSALGKGTRRDYGISAELVEDFIKASPKFDSPVYRGIGFSGTLTAGDIIAPKRFTSWSSYRSVAGEFSEKKSRSGNKMILQLNKTNNGVSVQHLSLVAGEGEVLVSGKIGFKVTNIEQYSSQDYRRRNIKIRKVTVEEVPLTQTKSASDQTISYDEVSIDQWLTMQEKWDRDFDQDTFEILKTKSIGLSTFFKGGPGSGSWNGPDDPRFAREGDPDDIYHGTSSQFVDKILKEGMKAGSGQFMVGVNSVYATASKITALQYSELNTTVGEFECAVITLNSKPFTLHLNGDRLTKESSFGPEYIKYIELYSREKVREILGQINNGVSEKEVVWSTPDKILYPSGVSKKLDEKEFYLMAVLEKKPAISTAKKQKSLGLSTRFKGGPGSGSWDGPDKPRFARESKVTPEETIEFASRANVLAEKLDGYAQQYGKDGKRDYSEQVTSASAHLRGGDFESAYSKLSEGDIRFDIPNTFTAVMELKDDHHIAETVGSDWGTKPGEYTAWRSGSIDTTTRGLFFSADSAGANAYSGVHEDAPAKQYRVSVKNPYVAKNMKVAYGHFAGLSAEEVNKRIDRAKDVGEWWMKADALIFSRAGKKGHDVVVYTRPAPPALREMIVIDPSVLDPKAIKSIGLSVYFKEGNANSGNYGHAGIPGHVGGSAPGGARNRSDDEIRQSIQDQRLLVSIYGGSPGLTKKEYELNFEGMTVADRLRFAEMSASKVTVGSEHDYGDVPPEFGLAEYGWQIGKKVPKGLSAEELRTYLKENGLTRPLGGEVPKFNISGSDLTKGLSDAEKDEFVEEFPKSSKRAIDDGKYQTEIRPDFEMGLSINQWEKLSDNFEEVSGHKGFQLKDGELDYDNRMDVQKLHLGEFSKDKEVALTLLLSGWAMTGGGTSDQKIIREVSVGLFPVNKGVLFYDSTQPGIDPGKKLYSKTRMAEHFAALKSETEDFYKKKFTKKSDPDPDLSMKTIDVWRGVGGHFDDYIPAAAESWSAQKSSANKYGKMTAIRDPLISSRFRHGGAPKGSNFYTLVAAKVSYNDVLWSYESVKGKYGWPPEKDLKGKKEFVVIGGALKLGNTTVENLND